MTLFNPLAIEAGILLLLLPPLAFNEERELPGCLRTLGDGGGRPALTKLLVSRLWWPVKLPVEGDDPCGCWGPDIDLWSVP